MVEVQNRSDNMKALNFDYTLSPWPPEFWTVEHEKEQWMDTLGPSQKKTPARDELCNQEGCQEGHCKLFLKENRKNGCLGLVFCMSGHPVNLSTSMVSTDVTQLQRQPMQLKTTSSLEAAIRWSMQWKPYGSTNLLGALDVALSRTFADCIYLFTDGKPDKPVLVSAFLLSIPYFSMFSSFPLVQVETFQTIDSCNQRYLLITPLLSATGTSELCAST
eukprot:Gb_08245 [translate_table: standard]